MEDIHLILRPDEVDLMKACLHSRHELLTSLRRDVLKRYPNPETGYPQVVMVNLDDKIKTIENIIARLP